MSEKFDIDHNRLFEALEKALEDDILRIQIDANGGKSILFVYPTDEDNLYIDEAKRRFTGKAIFVDVAQTLTDYQEEIGIETFRELEEDLGVQLYYRKGADDDFFSFLIKRIKLATTQNKPVFLVGTSALAGKGIRNINIMEDKTIMSAAQPLVYFYPSLIEGDHVYFLGDKNQPASQYRCRVIK
jgi:hypothetical protein